MAIEKIALKTALGDPDNLPNNTNMHGHKVITGKTLVSASWTDDGSLKKYSLSDATITANHIVDVVVTNADADVAIAAQLLPSSNSVAGAVEIWAKATPTGNIGVTLIINLKEG